MKEFLEQVRELQTEVNNLKNKKCNNFIKSDIIQAVKNAFNNLEEQEQKEVQVYKDIKRILKDLKDLKREEYLKKLDFLQESLNLDEAVEMILGEINSQKSIINNVLNNAKDSADGLQEIEQWTKNFKYPETKTVNLTPMRNDIQNEIRNVSKKIDSSSTQIKEQLSRKIDNIRVPKEIKDYLKRDDFEFTLNNHSEKVNKLQNSIDDLETLPKNITDIKEQISNLSEKIENIESSKKDIGTIPKESQAIKNLSKYMQDGLNQFENISLEYINKMKELEELEELKERHSQEIKREKENSLNLGKKLGEISFIKNFIDKFPSYLKDIQSEFIATKYENGTTLEINDENKEKILLEFSSKDELKNGKYKVVESVVLLDDTIIKQGLLVEMQGDIKNGN